MQAIFESLLNANELQHGTESNAKMILDFGNIETEILCYINLESN